MRAFAFLAVILLAVSVAFAQNVFHPATQVAPGIFGSELGGGNYTFNNSLFIVDKLGVGTTSLSYPLSVSGQGYFSDYLIASKLRSSAWGDVTGPAFTWEGDLSTGIYHPAAGKIALTMSGTEVMRLESGKVGIGTTTPSEKLNVNGSMRVDNSTGGAVLFVESINGRVGIGETGPGLFYRLQVKLPSGVATGAAYLTTSDYANGGSGSGLLLGLGANTGSTYSTITAISGGGSAYNNLILAGGGGKVGIGTTSPSQKLDVNGSVNVSGTVYANAFSSNSPLQLQTSGTTRLFINDTTGNIGVGSTSPNALLDVGASTPCYQETANVSTACGGLGTGTYAFSGTWTWPERVYDGDWETQSGSPVDGNFYVNYSRPSFAVTTSLWQVRTGGTPTTNFTIPSSCWSQNPLQFKIYINSSPGTEIGYCYNSTAWYQIFSSGYGNLYEDAMWWKKDVVRIGTDKLVIDPSGKVGIGTTTPSKTLTVVGNVNITGEVINYAAGHYYLGNAQSLGATTYTKIKIDTAQWNDNSGFNATNNRFIPPIAGYYICNGAVTTQYSAGQIYVTMYKNGADMKNTVIASANYVGDTGVVYLNGTDYVELWAQTTNAGALYAIDGYTWFECAKI